MLKTAYHKFVVVVFMLVASMVIGGCSQQEVYYFQSECPVSTSAKNLFVGWTGYYQIIGFFDDDGNLITDKAVAFQHGEPGGMTDESHELDEYFVVEQIPLGSYGIFLNQGYYQIGSSILPAQIPASKPPPGTPERLYYPCPDAYGSENIMIHIFKDEKATKLAGLWWITDQLEIDILEDGSIELDRLGIRAVDDDSTWWVSEKVGDKILMVKE